MILDFKLLLDLSPYHKKAKKIKNVLPINDTLCVSPASPYPIPKNNIFLFEVSLMKLYNRRIIKGIINNSAKVVYFRIGNLSAIKNTRTPTRPNTFDLNNLLTRV
jgi:hypothetical protein